MGVLEVHINSTPNQIRDGVLSIKFGVAHCDVKNVVPAGSVDSVDVDPILHKPTDRRGRTSRSLQCSVHGLERMFWT